MSSSLAPSGVPHTTEPFVERRIVGRALAGWDRLNHASGFPTCASCLATFDADVADGMILILIGPREEDDRIIECGQSFRRALGMDPVGQLVKSILPSATERGLVFWRVAAEKKKPIADVGAFTNAAGEEIVYRSVYMPISEDGNSVTHLLGAFSHRAVC